MVSYAIEGGLAFPITVELPDTTLFEGRVGGVQEQLGCGCIADHPVIVLYRVAQAAAWLYARSPATSYRRASVMTRQGIEHMDRCRSAPILARAGHLYMRDTSPGARDDAPS